jgi:membrane protein DedA with SNARE-associated domain
MFSHLVTIIDPLVQQYGALGVFLGSIIEEVVAPIPSTIVVFSAGVLLAGDLTGADAIRTVALSVMLPASAGIALGSLFPYYLARLGEEVLLHRWGKYLGLDATLVEKAKGWMQKTKRDEWLLFFARAVPVLPSVAISVTAGRGACSTSTSRKISREWRRSFLGCLV